jgi:hypothetical protein
MWSKPVGKRLYRRFPAATDNKCGRKQHGKSAKPQTKGRGMFFAFGFRATTVRQSALFSEIL